MIPSKNDGIEERAQKALDRWKALNLEWDSDPEAFRKKHVLPDDSERPKELIFGPNIPLVCDCCGRVSDWGVLCFSPTDYYHRHYADRYEGFVRVLDKIYYGCRKECSTALFTIHHQYAMTEKQKEDVVYPIKKDGTERCQ